MGNPITDPTLLFFAANAMLRANRFPRVNEKWEDLASADRNCIKWKTIYRKAYMAERVKNTTQGGQDQFGGPGVFEIKGERGGRG